MIHRSGTTAPKAPPELPPRHSPRLPKLIANYYKHYQDLQKSAPNRPKRTNLTNDLFTARRTFTQLPRIQPTPRAVFQKAEARAQHHDWADFSPYVPQAERLPDHASVFQADGTAKWFYRYPRIEPSTDSVENRQAMYYLAFPQTAGEQTAQSQSNINDRFLPVPINRNQEGIGFRHAALERHTWNPNTPGQHSSPYHHLEAYPSNTLILFS